MTRTYNTRHNQLMKRLDQVETDRLAEIREVQAHNLKPKLTDMGLYPGKKVRILFRAPFGDPIAVDIEGYTLSLRLEEAALIQVELVEIELICEKIS